MLNWVEHEKFYNLGARMSGKDLNHASLSYGHADQKHHLHRPLWRQRNRDKTV